MASPQMGLTRKQRYLQKPVLNIIGSSPIDPSTFSIPFDGATQYLSITGSSLTLPTTSTPFTVEAWVYVTAFTGVAVISSVITSQVEFAMGFTDLSSATDPNLPGAYLYVGRFSGWNILVSPTPISLNTWYHIATSFDGTTTRLFLNGTLVNSGSISWTTNAIGNFYLGRRWDSVSSTYFAGSISNFRFVKGVGVYTGNFTVPTPPLSITQGADTNISAITESSTVVLIQTPDIRNIGTSTVTIANVGGVYSQPFGPTYINNPTNFSFTSTIANVGYTTHVFRSSGVLNVSQNIAKLEVFVIGGGGGGGGYLGGGGGAGGVAWSPSLIFPPGSHTISIGSGGTGSPGANSAGRTGNDTTIGGIIVGLGGGQGGRGDPGAPSVEGVGGSGGGQGRPLRSPAVGFPLQDKVIYGDGSGYAIGLGSSGSAGAPTAPGVFDSGGGGGGAWKTGLPGDTSNNAGTGGTGTSTLIITTALAIAFNIGEYITSTNIVYYGGGGGGGTGAAAPAAGPYFQYGAPGGWGGGGIGSNGNITAPAALVYSTAGKGNSGGGGGGGGYAPGTPAIHAGSNGGSGLVIIRYPTDSVTSTVTTSVIGPIDDPYFRYNTLLLSGGTVSTSTVNNIFIDSSFNNVVTTSTGTITQGTINPYGSNWSNNFNGTTDYLSTSDVSAFNFGYNNFTIEGWIYYSTGQSNPGFTASNSMTIIGQGAQNNAFSLGVSRSGMPFGSVGVGSASTAEGQSFTFTAPVGVITSVLFGSYGTQDPNPRTTYSLNYTKVLSIARPDLDFENYVLGKTTATVATNDVSTGYADPSPSNGKNNVMVMTYGLAGPRIGPNTWNHLALVRSSTGTGGLTFYVNGVAASTATLSTFMVNTSTTGTFVGATIEGGGIIHRANGYLSNVRVINGSAAYTGNFTPPTSSLPITSDTVLLTCATNRFTNLSGTATLIISGYPSVQRFSPFPNKQIYNPLLNGNSAYFNGTSDYLMLNGSTSSYAFGTGDFSIEFWMYPRTWPTSTATIYDSRPLGSWAGRTYPSIMYTSSGTIRVNFNGQYHTTATSFSTTASQWIHVALIRTSSYMNLYVNGTARQSSFIDATDFSNGVGRPIIGTSGFSPLTASFNGYISDFRVIKGTGIYSTTTTTISIPNAPLTPINTSTSTSLLLNFDNGAVVDATMNNNLISNSTQGSISFNGSTQYLSTASFFNGIMVGFTGRVTTIEAWIYPTAAPTGANIFVILGNYTNTGANGRFYLGAVNTVTSNSASLAFNYTISPSAELRLTHPTPFSVNSWTHVALVVDGTIAASTNVTGYINGVGYKWTNQDMTTQSAFFTNNSAGVGQALNAYFTGYMTNVRVVKGAAVYNTPVFSVPTGPLQDVGTTGTTVLLLRASSSTSHIVDSSPIGSTLNNVGTTVFNYRSPFINTSSNTSNAVAINRSNLTLSSSWIDGNTQVGSVSFDGISQYLTLPINSNYAFGTNDFTVECWIYLGAVPTSSPEIFFTGDFHLNFRSSGQFAITNDTTVYALSPVTLIARQWYHIAAVRTSGSSVIYVNGIRGTPVACTYSFSQTRLTQIGTGNLGSGPFLNGLISNLRVVNGTAVYTTSTFSPPIGKMSAISGTQLLLDVTVDETNNSINLRDRSSNNATITNVNTATYSNLYSIQSTSPFTTGVLKNTPSSFFFNGVGQYLLTSPGIQNSLGYADFTIEFWMYMLRLNTTVKILSQGTFTTGEFQLIINTDGGGGFYESTTIRVTFPAGTFTSGEWMHIAVTRKGLLLFGYKNGFILAGGLNGTPYILYNYSSTAGIYIGCNPNASNQDFYGYIDELRITRGFSRYTGNHLFPTLPLYIPGNFVTTSTFGVGSFTIPGKLPLR